MPAQTQESKRAGMNAFLDIYEEFEEVMKARDHQREVYMYNETRVALFAAYISRME